MLLSDLCEDVGTTLPSDVVQAFHALGDAQRGKPEEAMLRVQYAMGGGVLNPVVEHVGDITHRMTHMVGYGMVLGYEKVQKTLRWLSHPYGFEREFRENLINNAGYRHVNPKQLAEEVSAALRDYAKAHAKLPVYNEAQWLARQAAVSIGLENFADARHYLETLTKISPTENAFTEKALEYRRNPDGTLQQWSPQS